jgi:hypothetical protein
LCVGSVQRRGRKPARDASFMVLSACSSHQPAQSRVGVRKEYLRARGGKRGGRGAYRKKKTSTRSFVHDPFISFFSSALRRRPSEYAKNIWLCKNAWKKGRSTLGVWSRKLSFTNTCIKVLLSKDLVGVQIFGSRVVKRDVDRDRERKENKKRTTRIPK